MKRCAKTTETARVQEVLDRYTDGLPRTNDRKVGLAYACKTIAIIGSTGFLGPYILAALLKANIGSHLVCLNRNDNDGQRTTSTLQRIMSLKPAELSRLRFLKADISQTNFGLDATQADMLAGEVDELVFSAWDPNWVKSLAHFDPFLKGIRNAIDFCVAANRRPRITFVSSICAVGDWPLVHPTQPKIPEDVVWDHRSAMPHGYGMSKCVAEQLLSKASEISGLAVNVVRVGQIGGPSDPCIGAWPRQGWLCSIIATSRAVGCFPDQVQPLDWIPVNHLADGIATCIKQQPSARSIQVFNMVHPQPVPWSMLYHTLRRQYNMAGDLVSLPQWLAHPAAKKAKLHGFLEATRGGREHNMSFSNERAVQVLPSVQPITQELLSDWLKSWGLQRTESRARL